MKNFTKLFSVLALGAISSFTFAQTYTDDFNTKQDYISSLDGTIWTGLKTDKGKLDDAAINTAAVDVLNTKDQSGALTFTTDSSNLAGNNDNAIILYKDLGAAGSDFDAKVQIVGGDFLSFGNSAVEYLMVGICAIRKDSFGYVAVQAFDRASWGAVYGLRNIPSAQEENWIWGLNAGVSVKQGTDDPAADTVKVADYPWQRLVKKDTVFTSYYSKNGTDWIKALEVSQPEWKTKELQVGLYNATYTTNPGTVVFDNFSIIVTPPVSVKQTVADNSLKAYYSIQSKSIIVSSNNSVIESVRVVNMQGQVVNFVNGNTNKLSVSVANKGLYVVLSRVNGREFSQKVIVK